MTLSPAVSLACDLIRCPSVTPQDAGALGVLEAALKAVGFETHRLLFSEPGTPDVDNLFAKIGSGSPHLVYAGHTDVVPTGDLTRWTHGPFAPHLVYAGHTDVVPTGDLARWTHEPFAAEIVDGVLYGRGASDMKGGIAAFAVAAIDYVKRHGPPKGTLSFLITGDEEGPSINGTVKMLDWVRARGERFDHAIVGEPTNVDRLGDTIKIGRRGSLNGRIRVIGKQGHVAYPHRADNPVPVMARIVAALTTHELDQGTAHFDRTNLEVTSIDVGNAAVNVIPGEARAQFNIRFNDAWTLETLSARVREMVAQAAGDAKVEIEFLPSNAVSFLTQPGDFTDLVAGAVKEVTGLTPELSTSGGTSDARFITRYCPVVEFGLTNETIHAIDENARVADIDALTTVYSKIIDRYFAR